MKTTIEEKKVDLKHQFAGFSCFYFIGQLICKRVYNSSDDAFSFDIHMILFWCKALGFPALTLSTMLRPIWWPVCLTPRRQLPPWLSRVTFTSTGTRQGVMYLVEKEEGRMEGEGGEMEG